MRRILINAETGIVQEIEGKKTGHLPIQVMYDLIGCDMVEHLGLVKGVHLWVDEEGRLKNGAIVNEKATEYFNKAFPKDKFIYPGGVTTIVGNAIIEDMTKDGWL